MHTPLLVDTDDLATIAGRAVNRINAQAQIDGIAACPAVGLNRAHRLSLFLSQVMQESGCFSFDRELWGPTKAQERYEGRKDLGNTEDGDGYFFRGRGPGQITGRANYARFRDWCRTHVDPDAPDFEATPDMALFSPWEGLSSVWFWAANDINKLADQKSEPKGGRVAAVTKVWNGGQTHLKERERFYVRAALHLIGIDPNDVRGFQEAAGLEADGIAGPITQAALHKRLVAMPSPTLMPASLEELVALLDDKFGGPDWRRLD